MQLVLKVPKNKLPLIGVMFAQDDLHHAQRLHSEVIEKYSNDEYKIKMELTPSCLNLMLINTERVSVYFYTHLQFDPEKLKSWLWLTKEYKEFSFGHFEKQLDKHKLILSIPSHKKFFVRIKGFELIRTEDPDSEWQLPFTTNNRKW